MKKIISATLILLLVLIGCNINEDKGECTKYEVKPITHKEWFRPPVMGYIEVTEYREVCVEWEADRGKRTLQPPDLIIRGK
jgi:uncharacterized lipoprotein NlpE involved in copper resistance